ncbi:MAG TPA: hypothetical protein VGN26_02805 [Armatimonadota bacterium]|jgi:hypothetical protein
MLRHLWVGTLLAIGTLYAGALQAAVPTSSSIEGVWAFTVQAPSGPVTGYLSIVRAGEGLTGVARRSTSRDLMNLEKVAWQDGQFSCVAVEEAAGDRQRYTFSGRMQGLRLTGIVSPDSGGSAAWTAERVPDIVGDWDFQVASPQGPITGKLTFARKAGKLTATAQRQGTSSETLVQDVSWENGLLSLRASDDAMGQRETYTLTAQPTGSRLAGTVTAPDGTMVEWSARRPLDIVGVWKFTVDAPGDPVTGYLSFVRKAGQLQGSVRLRGNRGDTKITVDQITWDKVSLALQATEDAPDQTETYRVEAKLQDGKLRGTVTTSGGQAVSWTAAPL